MSRISRQFESLKGAGALVAFIAAGDPDLATTEKLVIRLEKGGADIVELGIPFSDPLADGPSNQAAYQRALESGTTVAGILETVGRIRAKSQVPIILMTYFNPIHHYGLPEFARQAAEAGVDGVLITDLPPEEAGEWKMLAAGNGLDTIFLLAPTSTEERIRLVGSIGSGFIYCVSRLGVTGKRTEIGDSVRALVSRIREHANQPIVVGFGIAAPEDVREVVRYADGAIVGSAIVDKIAQRPDNLLESVEEFVRRLKEAAHR